MSNSRLLDASFKRGLKSTAHVACALGFEATGATDATSTCEADGAAHGKWSAVQLNCIGSLLALSFNVSVSSRQVYSRAPQTCVYALVAIVDFCVTSTLKGSVSQAELQTGAVGVLIGEQVSFKCAMGFESTGSPNARCTAGSDLLAKQGVWSGLSLICSSAR